MDVVLDHPNSLFRSKALVPQAANSSLSSSSVGIALSLRELPHSRQPLPAWGQWLVDKEALRFHLLLPFRGHPELPMGSAEACIHLNFSLCTSCFSGFLPWCFREHSLINSQAANLYLQFCFLGNHSDFLKWKNDVRQEKRESKTFWNIRYEYFIWKFSAKVCLRD